MAIIRKPSLKKKSIRIAGSRSASLQQARSRIVLVGVFFVLAYMLVLARVIDLSVLQGELQNRGAGDIEVVHAPEKEPKTKRADIVDRNGVLLATTLETASLYADPAMIQDAAEVARDVVTALPDLSYGEVLQKLQRKARFVWIKRNLTPDEQYEVLKLGHPGLQFSTEERRIYPQGRMAAHIVGYTDVDGNGLAGLERSFNGLLTEDHAAPLVTTFDVRVQHILHREVKEAFDHFGGIGAAGIVMDVVNGDILAAVSLPDFDPHEPGRGGSEALFNRLSLGVYELGSVFKIFSTAALLEYTGATMATTFDARESLQRGRFKINDYHAEKRVLTVPEVFIHSSNIGAALMGERVGTKALKDFYADLGFFEPASLEINEIGSPLIPLPWRDINTLTASYGHGIAVSPLQLASAVSAIVNGGLIVQPTLILDKSKAEMSDKSPDLRIISPQTAHRMRQLLRLTVTEGTGTHADIEGYRVGGKTGTAEKSDAGGYDRKKLISSFVGAFPMDDPRYVVFVMVDEPKGTKDSFGYATGGWVGAPAAGHVIAKAAPLLGLLPKHESKEQDMAASLKKYVHVKEEAGSMR